jgi:hypothetical protein
MTTNPYIAKVSEDLRGASATELLRFKDRVQHFLKARTMLKCGLGEGSNSPSYD